MFTKKISKRGVKEEKQLLCTIRFLDDSEPLSFTYQKDTKGQEIFDQVCHCLDLAEKDYFGLRYIDLTKQRHWLDLLKPVCRQLKYVNPVVLCFRVKFYPSDPTKLREEITRYFLFLQLRRDLHHGRLICSQNYTNLLAAFILQSEVGDYDPEEHLANYVGKFKMLPKQSHRQEEKIRELHRSLVGQMPGEAELHFLQKSATLETYGVDPHPVKDPNGNLLYLGVTHLGIVIFQGSKRTRIFSWSQINKITFEGKMFIVHVTLTEKSTGLFDSGNCVVKKHMYGYKCPTLSACKHLWKCAVEQQYFFTLDSGKNAPKVVSGGGMFTRGSRFRFSGRCEKETYKDELIERDEPRFIRASANPLFAQRYTSLRSGSVPATFNVLGLSEESLDSLNNYKQVGQWRSLDDFSRASTPHESPIVSEETNDFVYFPKISEDTSLVQPQSCITNLNQQGVNMYSNGEYMFNPQADFSNFPSFPTKMDESVEFNGQEVINFDSLFGSDVTYGNNRESIRKRQRHQLKHQQKTIYDECLDAFDINHTINNSNNIHAAKQQNNTSNSADGNVINTTQNTNNSEVEVTPKKSIAFIRSLKYLALILLLCCTVVTMFIFYIKPRDDSSDNDNNVDNAENEEEVVQQQQPENLSPLSFYDDLELDDEDL